MASVIEKTIRKTVEKGVMGMARINAARATREGPHPYLTGIHTPMSEELTLADLAVEGVIPAGLDGRYLRIGPNPVMPPNPATYHWFTGDGMAHGIRIKNGKALWYRNRWIRSDAVADALGGARAPVPEGRARGTVNTNIIGHAGKTLALVEAGSLPAELSDELETLAFTDFDGRLRHSFSAHPHLDPETGELHAICYQGNVQDKVWHTVVDREGRLVREEPIPVRHGPSIHDCAITPNYVIVLDLPVTFSMKAMIGGAQFPYRWNPDHAARVGLMPRQGSDAGILWYDVDPCYVFHPANAFEDADGSVVIDLVVHDRMFADSYDGPDGSRSTLERWTMVPGATRVERHRIDDTMQEFPRIDERLTGKRHRYIYTMAAENPGAMPGLIADTRLLRFDMHEGTREIRDFGAGRHPGEFVFVPRGEGEAEGWLIGLVVDMNDDSSHLVILDAEDFTGPVVASIRVPHRVPPGFHGNWVAS